VPDSPGPEIPDWRNAEAYRGLSGIDPQLLAWEWLRRDPEYCLAALGNDASAGEWGLQAFENPAHSVALARPVWSAQATFVLEARALPSKPDDDSFDLARFEALATLLGSPAGEHLLLFDGRRSLRLDIVEGTLMNGPVRLHYRLWGLRSTRRAMAAIQALASLARTGRLGKERGKRVVRPRDLMLLRAFDALRAGASQRDLAGQLLGSGCLGPGWRIERASLRSQAQRLARDARRMANGGFRGLLE
jgi:hypothetical protein